jgi:HD superfamily phosphodiesterase
MTDLIKKADNFVLQLFKEKLPNSYIYHNYNHTQRVVKSTKELIENSQLNVKEEEALLLAAWLHDTGYTKKFKGHEEESVKIATAFLEENNVEKDTIQMVTDCIMSTKFDSPPKTDLGKIIRDADSSHLAKEYFP